MSEQVRKAIVYKTFLANVFIFSSRSTTKQRLFNIPFKIN